MRGDQWTWNIIQYINSSIFIRNQIFNLTFKIKFQLTLITHFEIYIIPWIEFLFSNFFFLFMNWSQFSVRHIAKCYLNLLLQYCVQQHNNLSFGRIKAVFSFTLFAFHNLKNDRRVDSTQYYGTKWGLHQGCHPSTWKVDMKNEISVKYVL